MGKQARSEAQTPNLMIYYGGDFLFDLQINEAAIHDVLVMMGGLLAVCIFCTIHFRSAFLTFIVALQITLLRCDILCVSLCCKSNKSRSSCFLVSS